MTQELRDMKHNKMKDTETNQKAKSAYIPADSILKRKRKYIEVSYYHDEKDFPSHREENDSIYEDSIKSIHSEFEKTCLLINLLKKKTIELEKQQQKLVYHFFVHASPSLPSYSPDSIKSKYDQFDKILIQIKNLKMKQEQMEKQKFQLMEHFFVETSPSLPKYCPTSSKSRCITLPDCQVDFSGSSKRRKVL
jgi:hypothetical protein